MNQETLSRIIEAGQPVPITAGLMNAAHESAHRQRSAALRAVVRRVRSRAKAAIVVFLPNLSTSSITHLNQEIHS